MFDTEIPNIAVRTLPLPNETELLARMADGDELAFGSLFHHYRNRIYSYAFHLFGNAGLADELVQEVFLKLWLHRDKVRHLLKFDAWLFILARNQIFNMLKSIAKEETARRQMARFLEEETNMVDDHILTKENEQRLEDALNLLSPRQRLIFTMSRHKGMNHEQIARHLNISRNTVKTHLVHALKTLRNVLQFHTETITLVWLALHFLLHP